MWGVHNIGGRGKNLEEGEILGNPGKKKKWI